MADFFNTKKSKKRQSPVFNTDEAIDNFNRELEKIRRRLRGFR